MSSAILTLLSTEKVNGKNFATWKNKINTILIVEDLKFAFNEECPQVLSQNALWNVRDACEKWIKANEKARA